MVSFSNLDLIFISLFFLIVLLIGFAVSEKNNSAGSESYLLNGRKMGLLLFIFTNVSTWYGGILGVGEFTYKYGLVSWFTQGFPYYIFAILFAFLMAKKIRKSSLFTIPDKIEEIYGKKVSLLSGFFIFILISPAPYLLMTAYLISLIFNINLYLALIPSLLLSILYLFKGGYKADIYTDVFQFIVMFAGFILMFVTAYYKLGDFTYLKNNLPQTYLKFTGEVSPFFIMIWFLIASWTFIDPGFHQRCYAAKNEKTAFKGILISIIFWALFDFLTTSIGLYARANNPNLDNPVLSFPVLAENILGNGSKGIFYAALFATILSTLNSFMFLSATTFSRDFLHRLNYKSKNIKLNTGIGLILTSIVSVFLVLTIPSVIEIWYTIGSLLIPGLLLLVVSAYYKRLQIENDIALVVLITSTVSSLIWLLFRDYFSSYEIIYQIEPMIIGLLIGVLIHLYGIFRIKKIQPVTN